MMADQLTQIRIKKMSQSNGIVHTIGVIFEYNLQPERYKSSSRRMYYYYSDRDDIEVGDHVVVMAPTTGPTTVVVKEVYRNTKLGQAYKWVIDRVDFTDYNRRHEQSLLDRELELLMAQRKATQLQQVNLLEEQKKARIEKIRCDIVKERLQGDAEYQALQRQIDAFKEIMGDPSAQ